MKSFVPASCIDSVVDIFALTAHVKGFELKSECNGNAAAVVWGMKTSLQQVSLNLVGNAIKFPKSGSVTIQLRTQEEECVMLLCNF